MIVYTKSWGGAPLIFRLSGTAWPHGIIPGLIAVAVGFILGSIDEIQENMSDRKKFMDHPYPFQLYAFILGFLIVFRTNFAYQRYWEGRGTIAQMASKWLDGACMSVCFDAPGDKDHPYLMCARPGSKAAHKTENGSDSHARFVAEILHLFSLMHALALQHLRSDGDLNNLKGFRLDLEGMTGAAAQVEDCDDRATFMGALPESPQHSDRLKSIPSTTGTFTPQKLNNVYKEQSLAIIGDFTREERHRLEMDGHGNPIPTEARVTMVEGWIMRRLLARQKHEKCDMEKTSPPILSRLYQVISDGHIGFGQASKITETPFPFPYQNLLQMFLWIYVFTIPVIMNAWLKDQGLRISLTFMAVFCYFSLNQVGNNLEDPYIPYDPNEIALTHIQHSYNAKLLSYGAIPEALAEVTLTSLGEESFPIGLITEGNEPAGTVRAVVSETATQAKQAPPAAQPEPEPKQDVKAERLAQDVRPEVLNQQVAQNLTELAEVRDRCLHIAGVLDEVLTPAGRQDPRGTVNSTAAGRSAAAASSKSAMM